KMGGSTYGFQVGSTFKPFTAAAALEKGITPATSFSTDWKITLKEQDFRNCTGSPAGYADWPLQNELESEKG
ncbi:hypothetical protein G3M55_57090, partial [Streptomyces sp. SID8455]|nr:hypothetical protein [Streptomyces sp. SID8455]